MQDISSRYRILMRIGSVISLCFLAAGLLIHMLLAQETVYSWDWRNGYAYLMIGIVSLLLTPVAGLVAFFVFSVRQRQFAMAILIIALLVLLIGGTWIIHPGR